MIHFLVPLLQGKIFTINNNNNYYLLFIINDYMIIMANTQHFHRVALCLLESIY